MSELYGVVNGVQICNQFRNEELNLRLSQRNIPSNDLPPQFSIRPVSTKYSLMPIVDTTLSSNVPINHLPTYNVDKTFNPVLLKLHGAVFLPILIKNLI